MLNGANNLKISDYKRKWSSHIKKWLYPQDVPQRFWKRFSNVRPQTTIKELLTKIDKELMRLYKGKKYSARSFADSRFTPISLTLKRGMVSCGALSTIYSIVLRKLGIPTKLVHGRVKGQKGENRHAWLKLYNPIKKTWFSVDPTQWHRNFKVKPSARQLKIYRSWEELKSDYRKGRF